MPIPAEVLTTDPLVHQYVVRPHRNGEPFDPYIHGGTVNSLILRTPVNQAIVFRSDPAIRVAYGVYRFDLPESVPHGTYLAEVEIQQTPTSPVVAEDFDTITIPGRAPGPVMPWTTYKSVLRRDDELHKQDAETVLESIDAASHVLYLLSGRKYRGRHTVTEVYRPLRSGAPTGYSHARPTNPDPSITLRGWPVHRVRQVVLEDSGRIVPPTEYTVEDNKYLVPARSASWSPATAVRVTYDHGANPPQLARSACDVLAAELAKGAFGMETCRLPDRVTSISRQGVSYTVLDPQDFLEKGRTGLYEVDMFLHSINPDKARVRPRVFTPGNTRARRVSHSVKTEVAFIQDLFVMRGEGVALTFRWATNNLPNVIGGYWAVRSFAGDLDLSPYITVEPNREIGIIDLSIPAADAMLLRPGASWYLEVVDTMSGETRRLITGVIRSA